MKAYLLLTFLMVQLFAQVAQVVSLRGDATFQRAGVTTPLKLGDGILKTDRIDTAKNARLQIMFEDETVVTLGKSSTFIVRDYLHNNSADAKLKFKFVKGVFNVISGKIGKLNPKKFKIVTQTSAIGIRGTQILLRLEEKSEFIMCTEGSILVTSLSSGEQTILDPGESITIDVKGEQPSTVQKENQAQSQQITTAMYQDTKVDTKYDEWIDESSVESAVSEAFDKGHNVSYTNTQISGTIDEGNHGLQRVDMSNSTFNLSIDFGKDMNDNPVSAKLSIVTTLGADTRTSSTSDMTGNLDTQGNITLNYVAQGTAKTATGDLKIVNSNLDVEGTNVYLQTQGQSEDINLTSVKFEKN